MQGFVEYVVKGLVSHPEDVSVTPVEREGTTIYEVRMHPEDVGKVIGRQGMTINAIRSLLLSGSARKGVRCSLEIVEDQPAAR
jgi:predicted RNA-binding protein YlqC (UPF0109 family)